MPVYEYRCQACGALSEQLVLSVTNEDSPPVCAQCGSESGLTKIFSVFAAVTPTGAGESQGECYSGNGPGCGGGCSCC